MSLGVSPNTPSPILTRPARPHAAHRKRASISASRASTPLASPPPMSSTGGVLGGLRERSEDELRRASREDMEVALREECGAREHLLERLNALEADQRNLQSERNELSKVVVQLQGRVEEAFNEQHRLEADLESRDQVLDRLRIKVGEGERALRDGQKRYAEQEKSFEAEREAFRAQESQWQSRINTLRSRLEAPTPVPATETPAAEDELASLQASHNAVLARLNTISKEMTELKARNAQLEEDNAGWELLMRERTMSGRVLDGGLFQRDEAQSPPPSPAREKRARRKSRKSRGELEKLDEETELEEEMDDLHSDLEMQSPILGEEDVGFVGRRQGPDGASRRVNGMLAPPSRSRPKGENLGDLPVTGSGLDLAAELGRAEVDLDGNEMPVLGKGDEGEALRGEVKQLREANKALTLYCSKIIDRIIAQEGFEQILSVDYKTRRGLRTSSASSGTSGISYTIKKPKTRPSLKDITQSTQDVAPPHVPAPTVTEEPEKEKKKERKARPLSMMFRSSSAIESESVETKEDIKATPPAPASDVEETKAEKRARRGFSLDLRSFGFGTTPIESPKPRLKPLALSNRKSTLPTAPKPASSASATPASSLGHSVARKCDVEEEDENDRRERHHLEASLKLMGIDRSPSPSISDEPAAGGGLWGLGILAKTSPRDSGPTTPEVGMSETDYRTSASSSAPFEQRGTPLTRLSERFGIHASPLLEHGELEEGMTGETVKAALEETHQRDQALRSALAIGKQTTGFTSPRRATRRKHVEGGKVVKSESISTLWSMGSGGSRPGSRELAPAELEHLR